jgi:hypothetical protein
MWAERKESNLSSLRWAAMKMLRLPSDHNRRTLDCLFLVLNMRNHDAFLNQKETCSCRGASWLIIGRPAPCQAGKWVRAGGPAAKAGGPSDCPPQLLHINLNSRFDRA